MKQIVGVNFGSTFAFSSIFLILPSSIQKSFTTILNQHLIIFTRLSIQYCTNYDTEVFGSRKRSRKRAVPLSRPSKRSRSPSFDIVDHLPDFAPSRLRCAFCSSKNVESRTYVRCITCNIALCLQKDRNCFQQYHTKQ